MNNTTDNETKVEFDERGLYFVTCPDCADKRLDFADEYPASAAEGIIEVKCRLCKDSGDLCVTIDMTDKVTPEELEALIAARREEIAQ